MWTCSANAQRTRQTPDACRRTACSGHDLPAWSEEEAYSLLEKHGLRLADEAEDDDAPDTDAPAAEPATEPAPEMNGEPIPVGPTATIRELHENRELERVFSELAEVGLSIDDWALVQEESVTGAKLPARFAWETTKTGKAAPEPGTEASGDAASDEDAAEDASAKSTSRVVEAANLAMIVPALREIGRRGMEIKRFKGLGEMDAIQLWDTTMDPDRRTMLRVTWDMGQEAEYLFSTLMGEHVEPRRKFIEDHALEVKNLDV